MEKKIKFKRRGSSGAIKLRHLKPGARKQISKQNILEALQCHASPYHECDRCPYQEYNGCSARLARDASALIEEMEQGTEK